MDKWTICNKTGDFDGISERFGVSLIMARLLINRDMTDYEEVRSFLHPTVGNLNSPYLMKNLDTAAGLVAEKIASGRRIRIVGDYDVDGIMATFILHDALSKAGAKADWYIPHRIRDGYGLNEDIIRSAASDGIDTLITVDNGIAAVSASELALSLGLTLIITDHHEIPDVLPRAAVIVDPKQEDETYPCREICGAVVAAKLAEAVFDKCNTGLNILRYLEFMAMATVCDVVALKGENRVIAKLGIEALKTTSNPGLAALIRETGIQTETLNEYHLGYILGPCFNATGRIDDASMAFELLAAADNATASRLALECKNLNEDRKQITAEQEQLAFARLDAMGDRLPKVIVLDMPGCHESILGIIAGRIKERYLRPAIAITKSGDNYKGSARSIPAYNMFEELCKCSSHLVKFGGHPMAAGLTIRDNEVDDFRNELNDNCGLSEEDMVRKIVVDAEVSFNLFTEDIVNEIDELAPFGQGNAAPLFAERGLKCKGIRCIGRDNNFLRFKLVNNYGAEFTAVCFMDANEVLDELIGKYGKAEVDRALAGGDNNIVLTAAYVPRVNEYRDIKELQMNIKALRI